MRCYERKKLKCLKYRGFSEGNTPSFYKLDGLPSEVTNAYIINKNLFGGTPLSFCVCIQVVIILSGIVRSKSNHWLVEWAELMLSAR